MMLYLRLFAGLTSLISNLALSHAFSIGPEGIFESSFISASEIRANQPGHHRKRDRNESGGHQDRDPCRRALDHGRVARVAESNALKHAPQSVIQVHAEQHHRENVERRDWNPPE